MEFGNQRIGGVDVLFWVGPAAAEGFINSGHPLAETAAMLLATYLGSYRHVMINGDRVRLCGSMEARLRRMCIYTDLEGAIIITDGRMTEEVDIYKFHGHVDHRLYAMTLGRRLGIESPEVNSEHSRSSIRPAD